MKGERVSFDRVFHFVESYFIMDHCVPLASITLFGNTRSPCVRYMGEHPV